MKASRNFYVAWYYAVTRGRNVGIFNSWDECRQHTHHFPNAKFKKFRAFEDAKAYVNGDLDGIRTERSFRSNAEVTKKAPFVTSSASLLKNLSPIIWSHSIDEEGTPRWLVFSDGDCDQYAKPNGPGSAGVKIFDLCLGNGFEGAKFFDVTTNNRTEHLAQNAALKIALKLPGVVFVLGDSKLAQQQLVGNYKVKAQHLLDIVDEGRKLWTQSSTGERRRIFLHQIRGHHGNLHNPADKVAKRCRETRQDIKLDTIDCGYFSIEIPFHDLW